MAKKCELCDKEIESKIKKYCSDCRIIRDKEIAKKYREKNKEKRNNCYKEWAEQNKEKIATRMKTYNKIYKETHREERKIYRKTKKEIDIGYEIEQKLRSKLHTFYKSKKNNYFDLVGCKPKDFKKWLEYNFTSDMNWDNYGTYWNMDHVFPVSIFNLINEEEQKYCFNWKNTRPILCLKNFSRKYSYFDSVLHELKIYFFCKNGLNLEFNNIYYGVLYLPNQSRNCLMDLVNN